MRRMKLRTSSAAADEEDRGERDLDDYEDAAQPVALQEAEPAHPLNACVTQRRHDVDARSLQGRCEPEQKSGRERQQRRKQQHAAIDGDLVYPGNVARADRGQGPLQPRARPTPRMPPATASSMLSVRSCRARRRGRAPSAVRTASSR